MSIPNVDTGKFTNHGAALEDVGHRVADRIAQASDAVPPIVERLAEQTSDLARRGADKISHSTQDAKVKFDEVSNTTRAYIRDEPMRAMLIAAGVGAALMMLARVMSSTQHRR